MRIDKKPVFGLNIDPERNQVPAPDAAAIVVNQPKIAKNIAVDAGSMAIVICNPYFLAEFIGLLAWESTKNQSSVPKSTLSATRCPPQTQPPSSAKQRP